jgi:hypothetical protein
MSQPTVIVVEDAGGADSGEGTAPPAGPAYVTEGELAARLELIETRLGDRISSAMSEAFAARDVAEAAQDVALTAAAVAADAAAEVDAGDEDQGDDDDADDETPQPPEKRSAPAAAPQGGSRAPAPKKYGAGFLSGR